jgi:hypothetical protein
MSKKKSGSKSAKRDLNDVVFITSVKGAAVGTIEAHSKSAGSAVTKPLEQLKEDWTVINQQVVVLLNQTAETSSQTGYTLDEVSFALGISGKGHIGFLAGIEAGGEASITLTFKKKGS